MTTKFIINIKPIYSFKYENIIKLTFHTINFSEVLKAQTGYLILKDMKLLMRRII